MGSEVGNVNLRRDRTLVVRPVPQIALDEKVKAVVGDVFRRRRSALKRLAR